MSSISLVNATLIDGSGAEPVRATIDIKDDRIVSITRAGPGAAPPRRAPEPDGDTTIIDCTGHTVMPGLTEAHCHISFNDIRMMEAVVAIQPEDHSLLSLSNAQMLMDRGFTSLYSAAAAKPRLDVAVRNAIDSGMFAGPRIRAASQEMSPSGNLGDLNNNYLELPRSVAFTITVDGEQEFTKASRLAARDGVDNLKINVSGDRDWGYMHADDKTTVIKEEEVAAVVSVARPRRLMVNAHCTSSEGVKMCVRQGVQVVYHAVHADEEARDMLEAAKDWVFVAPAIGLPLSMLRDAPDYGLKWGPERYASLEKEVATTRACMRDLKRRGVRVLPGGDYGAFITNPMGNNARDLEHFVDFLGFSPMETLVAATKWGGELMQRGDELGQLKPGYLADLLIVDGDPLADIRILQDKDRIRAVMVGGKLHKNLMQPPSRAAGAPAEPRRVAKAM
jgi:imidazolonepropionase-like amidohydrolase